MSLGYAVLYYVINVMCLFVSYMFMYVCCKYYVSVINVLHVCTSFVCQKFEKVLLNLSILGKGLRYKGLFKQGVPSLNNVSNSNNNYNAVLLFKSKTLTLSVSYKMFRSMRIMKITENNYIKIKYCRHDFLDKCSSFQINFKIVEDTRYKKLTFYINYLWRTKN